MNTSVNDLKLDSQLMATLYTNVLVGNLESTNKPAAPPLKYLGNNEKNITILVSYSDDVYLPEDALTFLTKILQACNLTIADIAIINTPKQPDWQNHRSSLKTEKLISFGTTIPGKTFTQFSIENDDNILSLIAPPLSEFTTDSEQAKEYKKKLWSCLKQLFQIK